MSPSISKWSEDWRTMNLPWARPEADNFLRRVRRVIASKKSDSASALVPLCGHSPSVRLLHSWGFAVTGVEFVPRALREMRGRRFPRMRFKKARIAGGIEHSAERLRLLELDIFKFAERAAYDVIYDRAALVALAPSSRKRYAVLMRRALKPGGALVVVAFSHRGGNPKGPPFPITEREVRRLFPGFRAQVRTAKVTPAEPRFAEEGVRETRYFALVLRKSKS